MLTPYDWQEGIGHRASYVEAKLSQGAPVLALSIDAGIVLFTFRRHARKIFEIYDQLAFGAIGQQSDVESLRVGAIDFAHQEGFNRSEQDVTIQRVVTAMSTPLKRAFSDFNSTPFVAKALFAEVAEKAENDVFYILDYSGDYTMRHGYAYVAGTDELGKALKLAMKDLSPKGLTPRKAIAALRKIWQDSARDADIEEEEQPKKGLIAEAGILERGAAHENRFRMLSPATEPDAD